jgi:hypothetical protein
VLWGVLGVERERKGENKGTTADIDASSAFWFLLFVVLLPPRAGEAARGAEEKQLLPAQHTSRPPAGRSVDSVFFVFGRKSS